MKKFFLLLLVGGSVMQARPVYILPQHIPPHRETGFLEAATHLDQALLSMQKILASMHELARWKWNAQSCNDDHSVETLSFERALVLALEKGVSEEQAAEWIHAQIEAAKMLIHSDFEYWSRQDHEPFDVVSDPKTELRPYVESLLGEVFERLVKVYPLLEEHEACRLFLQPPLSKRPLDAIPSHVWNRAIEPLHCGPHILPMRCHPRGC